MSLPADYLERTYAGVLGKIIGVFMGRPFEGWSYADITERLGPIWYYVNEKLNKPLIVSDDDITGTFTFIRALDDYDLDLSAGDEWSENVGKTWLNYLINRKSILWWGGIGRSTEHTAYARLAAGIPAPRSGSIEENGAIIGEQIGAQIFIDGWGMVAPGDPEKAAWLAGQAGHVSHDGESVYASQVVAAMESAAYTEPDMARIMEVALSQVPQGSTIRRMATALQDQRVKSEKWEDGYNLLLDSYGYDKYKGQCHVVPNHGLILMTLLYAPDSFQKAMMIVNTSGWDTDCNSANIGCIMGIHLGLDAFEGGPDYRGPVRDQIYLPTADGSSCLSDATREAYKMANRGRKLAGEEPMIPKDGARYHFELPGSTQGFRALEGPEWTKNVTIGNELGHSETGTRALKVEFSGVGLGQGVALATETFVPEAVFDAPGYEVTACPILYSGQRVTTRIELDGMEGGSLIVRLIAITNDKTASLKPLRSETTLLRAGGNATLNWTMPDTGGYPIMKIGIEARVAGDENPGEMAPYTSTLGPDSHYLNAGTLYVDYLRIDGIPTMELGSPDDKAPQSKPEQSLLLLERPKKTLRKVWLRQWVNGVTTLEHRRGSVRPIQDTGTGLFYTGDREWSEYRVSAEIIPNFFTESGIAIYVQGMKHYLAAVVRRDSTAAIVEMWDEPVDLASGPVEFAWEAPLVIEVWVDRSTIHAEIGGVAFSGEIQNPRLRSGGTGVVLTEGTVELLRLGVSPI